MENNNPRSIGNQTAVNLVSSVMFFLINLIIGLWFVPYLIHNLSVEGYGLIPLASQLTSYAQLLTIAVNGAVARYLTIAIQQGNEEESNRIFNTAFFALSILLFSMIPLIVIFILYIPQILDIPPYFIRDAQWLFAAIMAAFIVNTWTSNFAVSPYALNRLDLRNYIDIAPLFIRIVIIVASFMILGPALYQVGLGYLGGTLFGLGLSVLWWKKLTPNLHIDRHKFSLVNLKELIGTGGWLVINQIGTLLFLSIDLIVVNKLFGATAGGEYAAIMQWSSLLRSIAGTLAGVMTPLILIYYAQNQKEQLIGLSKTAVKFMGLSLALPIGLVGGLAAPLITIWLGREFSHLAPLLLLMVSHLIINLAVLPLFSINVATNSVKIPGIVTIIMGLGNLGLALVLPMAFGWGYYGVAAAGAIVLTCKNAIFTPWYATRVLNIRASTFNKAILPGVFWGVVITGICYFVSTVVVLSTWSSLIVTGSIISVVYALCLWFINLTREEKTFLLSFIPGYK